MQPSSSIERGAPHGVLAAYRAAHRRNAVALDDGSWIPVGSLLEHAAALPIEQRRTHLDRVATMIRAILGEPAWRTGHPSDPEPPASDETLDGRVRAYCEQIEDAGAIELSDAILVAYLAADPTAPALEQARVEAVRARLAWKSGDLDAATERYRRVAKAGRRLRSDELRVRAWIGETIVARLRGNYPASRAAGLRAIALSERARLGRLLSSAHHAMMVAEAVGSGFESAIEHGWQAYLHAGGDRAMESAALGNVGQLFLDAGHPATAAAAFRAVLQRQPADRILVPALGGFAIAAARLNDAALLENLTQQIVSRITAGVTVYDAATVTLDLARAYLAVHESVRTNYFRSRARELARTHGFHEIVHHADQIDQSAPAERPLSPRVATVADAVRELVGV